jgi:glycosyltransferase involved in cell wall biosynthesis
LKINWANHIPLDKISDWNGFGYATNRILNSLGNLGYEVGVENADVNIWFDQPHWINWTPGQYRIAYFPWESTKLMPEWYPILNSADEVWTTSDLIARWLRADAGITPPVYVFEHGVDKVWTPMRREVDDKIKFLHLGFESARKYGPQTLNLFRKAFADDHRVSLTMKMNMSGWNIQKEGKVTIINRKQTLTELISLFHDHHAFIYISAGEGFGLPALQAIASGMPAVVNPEWAPYSSFLDERLTVSSVMKKSPWQDIHPGEVFRPNYDEFVDKMRFLADNYVDCARFAYDQTEQIFKYYDWDRLTAEAFENLQKRL